MKATTAVVAAMHGRITVLKHDQTYLAQTNVPSTHPAMSFPFSPTPLRGPSTVVIVIMMIIIIIIVIVVIMRRIYRAVCFNITPDGPGYFKYAKWRFVLELFVGVPVQ